MSACEEDYAAAIADGVDNVVVALGRMRPWCQREARCTTRDVRDYSTEGLVVESEIESVSG